MREIITDWVTPGSPGGVTVMYFDEAVAVEDQRVMIGAAWDELEAVLVTGTSWSVRDSGRIMDETTGTLTGLWSDPTPIFGVGTNVAEPVANSTQLVLQWLTGTVINGRVVRGRTYVPGLSRNSTSASGGPNATTRGAGLAAGANLIALPNGFGVWHRPSPNGVGSLVEVTATGVWEEFGVQRGRR